MNVRRAAGQDARRPESYARSIVAIKPNDIFGAIKKQARNRKFQNQSPRLVVPPSGGSLYEPRRGQTVQLPPEGGSTNWSASRLALKRRNLARAIDDIVLLEDLAYSISHRSPRAERLRLAIVQTRVSEGGSTNLHNDN